MQQSASSNYIQEFKLSLTQGQVELFDSWLDVLTFLWNRELSIKLWVDYQENLNRCRFYPCVEKEEKVFLPQETLDRWGFQNIALAFLKIRKVNEKPKVYALFAERTTYTKISLNDYPGIKSGECHREEFPKQGNQPGYAVLTGLAELHENQFILQLNTSKGIVFQLHSVASWANQKAHYLKPCAIADNLPISYQQESWRINTRRYIVADNFVPDSVKQVFTDKDSICSRMLISQSQSLQLSWELYRKGQRGCPRFKVKGDRTKTLINSNAKGKVKVLDGDRVRLPKIPFALKVKGLNKRYNGDLIVGFKIAKKASGWYLQLTLQGDRTPRKIKIRENEIDRKVVGIDAGVVCLFADSEGHIFSSKPRRHEVVRTKRLRRLQRKLSRQKLKSNNWKKTQYKLALTHEKIARQRRSRDHYHSTMLVREYDAIAVEDLNLGGMTRASKTKVEANAKTGKLEYAKVKRKQKSGLNKALLRNTPGQRHALIESKAKMADREFKKVKAAYSSRECHHCGHISDKNRISQAVFKCENCGHEDHADKNAAKVIRDRGLKAFKRSYPAYTGKVTPVEISTSTSTLLSGGGAQEPSNGIQESNSPEIAPTLTNPDHKHGNQKPEPIRAKPETLASPDFNGENLKATLPPDLPKNQKRKRSAQNPDPNQLTLDLWNTG